MSEKKCDGCGVDPNGAGGHACHCVRDVGGQRVAVGVCCGRTLGADTLADEDAADVKRKARQAAKKGAGQ